MFLDRIRDLSKEHNVSFEDLQGVTKESFLYATRLERRPVALKRELKKLQLHPRLARQMWWGNSYMLLVFPQVLCNPKKKIPSLEDFIYVKNILKEDEKKALQEKVLKLGSVSVSRTALLDELIPKSAIRAQRGRFLAMFDPMYSSRSRNEDVRQDLAVEAVAIINRELSNLKTDDPEKINSYLGFCLNQKAKTYLTRSKPKTIRVRAEEQTIEKIRQETEESPSSHDRATMEMASDLRSILRKDNYRAIALLLEFADKEDRESFNFYLGQNGLTRIGMTPKEVKSNIEKFLGKKVFYKLKKSAPLRKYLGMSL
jgi:hypothetical protein